MTSALKAKFRPPGGVHPEYRKELTVDKPTRQMPLPALLSVSMSQHLGAPARPLVKKGDTVLIPAAFEGVMQFAADTEYLTISV